MSPARTIRSLAIAALGLIAFAQVSDSWTLTAARDDAYVTAQETAGSASWSFEKVCFATCALMLVVVVAMAAVARFNYHAHLGGYSFYLNLAGAITGAIASYIFMPRAAR